MGSGRAGLVEQLAFGTQGWDRIDASLDRLCTAYLGAGIAEVLFRATSVGVVTALVLTDGRRVVVKVHGPDADRARLQAVHSVQGQLHAAGFPCPEPLLAPVALHHGQATVERLVDVGEFRDTHDPTCRRLIAEALAWHQQITRSVRPTDALAGGWSLYDPDRLWPERAHAPIFDFGATAAGAEWIDDLAARAKDAIDLTGASVVGHGDWSGKHFRFAQDAITAVYDWDSLGVRLEAAILGAAAMTFTTRFDLPGVRRSPTPEEMTAFLDEYGAARSATLRRAERAQAGAWGLLLAAYTARCEHCRVGGYDPDVDADSFTAALRTYGYAFLNP